MFVVEALPILLLTIFETLRQQPTISFYWLVLNNPENGIVVHLLWQEEREGKRERERE